MSEDVFNVVQMGLQGGTFSAPSTQAAAKYLFPISDKIMPDLELGSAYPALDRGRNVRNLGGSGYHGVRKAGVTIPSEVRFEDIPAILEMLYCVAPTPTAGTTAITAASVANPTHVTATAHGLTSGDTVTIAGSDSTPTINGSRVVTVLDADHFTIPVNVTVAATTGTVTTGYYSWLFAFEAGAATVIPKTIETGNIDASQAQEALVSALVSKLTLGFSSIKAGQASPWTLSAEVMAFNRVVSALTGSLSSVPSNLNGVTSGLETVQGHLTRLYEGPVSTAFGSLSELGSSLKSFTMSADRLLVPRAYGSSTDQPTKWGYTDLSNATYEAVVAVGATAKTDLHDVWNTSGATLGERRLRLKAIGSGSKSLTVDARAGMFAIPWDDDDGERVYKVTGEFADDTTLGASHAITVVNAVSALPA